MLGLVGFRAGSEFGVSLRGPAFGSRGFQDSGSGGALSFEAAGLGWFQSR